MTESNACIIKIFAGCGPPGSTTFSNSALGPLQPGTTLMVQALYKWEATKASNGILNNMYFYDIVVFSYFTRDREARNKF